jgi:hypothetical protein
VLLRVYLERLIAGGQARVVRAVPAFYLGLIAVEGVAELTRRRAASPPTSEHTPQRPEHARSFRGYPRGRTMVINGAFCRGRLWNRMSAPTGVSPKRSPLRYSRWILYPFQTTSSKLSLQGVDLGSKEAV